jgi:hypothetical protein
MVDSSKRANLLLAIKLQPEWCEFVVGLVQPTAWSVDL